MRARQAYYCYRRLQKLSIQSPHCSLAKLTLLEAEMMALRGSNRPIVLPKYIIAISVAKRIGNLLLTALANELTAKYILSTGFPQGDACRYIEESILTYDQWGAHAKAIQLQQEFSLLH
jgi:hypothetical protein